MTGHRNALIAICFACFLCVRPGPRRARSHTATMTGLFHHFTNFHVDRFAVGGGLRTRNVIFIANYTMSAVMPCISLWQILIRVVANHTNSLIKMLRQRKRAVGPKANLQTLAKRPRECAFSIFAPYVFSCLFILPRLLTFFTPPRSLTFLYPHRLQPISHD